MIYRELYMNRILPFVDKPFIKILTGIRRSGKSTILKMIQAKLLDSGIKSEQILFYRFDSIELEFIKPASDMFNEIKSIRFVSIYGEIVNSSSYKNMNGMFYECHSLIELDLSKFNIGKVKDMRYMFFGCHSLENLILFNYATIAHPRMEDMFNGCTTSFKEKLKRKNRIFYHLYLYFINNKYY